MASETEVTSRVEKLAVVDLTLECAALAVAVVMIVYILSGPACA